MASAVTLPADRSAWFRIIAFLDTSDVLGRLAVLSIGHVTLLAEDLAWSTFALPPGAPRTTKLLELALVEERELWAPLMRQVQVLDLDLVGTGERAVSLLRELLLHGLALDGALTAVHVRRIPVCQQRDPCAQLRFDAQLKPLSKRDASIVRLVNPVTSRASTAPRLFLLDPNELGRLRFMMAAFRFFRLQPSENMSDVSVDLVAMRANDPPGHSECAQNLSAAKSPKAEDTEAALEKSAVALAIEELGELQRLPEGEGRPGRGDFSSWLDALLPRYVALLNSWD